MKQYRQGDVLLVQVDEMPAGAEKLDHTIVARGEATGHNHAFAPGAATLFQSADRVFVLAEQPAALTHQEHGIVVVAPGVYEVRIQREYAPQAVRRVAD